MVRNSTDIKNVMQLYNIHTLNNFTAFCRSKTAFESGSHNSNVRK